jgi:predicted glutamine amidotransferase
MCRLFGLSAAPRRVTATFWLIDAPDSLAVQSRRQPDGVGLGLFEPDGTALVHKRPIAAYEDTEFAREAREVSSSTFLAHVRYASTGGVRTESTHPFLQDGRLFAHNGVVTELDRLRDRVGEKQRGPVGELVGGDTDSELVSALITAYARQGGAMGRAIVAAAGWIAANLPVYALNLVVTTPADMWALRYPDTHPCTCWPDRPAVITATGTWNTPAPPHGTSTLRRPRRRTRDRRRQRTDGRRPALAPARPRRADARTLGGVEANGLGEDAFGTGKVGEPSRHRGDRQPFRQCGTELQSDQSLFAHIG